MKKFVTILMMIIVVINLSAIAEVEPYGGYTDDGFWEFVYNSTITDATFYDGTAHQEMWFENGWHIVGELDGNNAEEANKDQEAILHVYDDTHWIVESYTITNDDQGTQQFWDIVYGIYKGEL